MIPYGKHHIDSADIKAITDVLKKGYLTQGPTISLFEKKFAKYVGAKYAVAVSSCTAGLHIAVLSTNIKKNEYLVTSSITFVASPNSAIYSNAKVILSDIDKETLNINSSKLKEAINKFRNSQIKIIMPVHFGGYPCDMKEIKKLANKHKSFLIEDAAHALGGQYKCGSKVGSCKYSDMTVFSMHPVKSIAACEGGIITTNSKILYKKLLKLRSHGINKNDDKFINKMQSKTNGKINPWYYEMQELGFHYRITDIQCALASSQLNKLKKFISKRRKLVSRYDNEFKNNQHIKPTQLTGRKISSLHIYVVRIDFSKLKITRAELMNLLKKNNVITQVHYLPIHYHPFYNKNLYNYLNDSNSVDYYKEALTLPLYYDLSFNQQDFVIRLINKIINKYKK